MNEAIAYEMAARFWRARGYPLFGDAYLQEACACYRRWGAEGKVSSCSSSPASTPASASSRRVDAVATRRRSPSSRRPPLISWTSWR